MRRTIVSRKYFDPVQPKILLKKRMPAEINVAENIQKNKTLK